MKEILTAGQYYLEIGCALFPSLKHTKPISDEEFYKFKSEHFKEIPEKIQTIDDDGNRIIWNSEQVIEKINGIIDCIKEIKDKIQPNGNEKITDSFNQARETERREVLCGERSIYDTPLLDRYYKKRK